MTESGDSAGLPPQVPKARSAVWWRLVAVVAIAAVCAGGWYVVQRGKWNNKYDCASVKVLISVSPKEIEVDPNGHPVYRPDEVEIHFTEPTEIGLFLDQFIGLDNDTRMKNTVISFHEQPRYRSKNLMELLIG